MVRSGLVRLLGAPVLGLLALLPASGPVMADVECSVTVEPASAVGGSKLPALIYLMVVGFGLTGGAFLSRRLGAARSGLRH